MDARKLEEANLSWLMIFLCAQLAAHTNTQFYWEAEAGKPVRHWLLCWWRADWCASKTSACRAAVGSCCAAATGRATQITFCISFKQMTSTVVHVKGWTFLHFGTVNDRFSGERFSGPKTPDDAILFTVSGKTVIADKKDLTHIFFATIRNYIPVGKSEASTAYPWFCEVM